MKTLIALFLLIGLTATAGADSVWDKRRDDGPEVDRYFWDDDPFITQARVFMLGVGLQGYYQRKSFLFPSVDFEVAVWRYLTLGLFVNFHTSSDTGYSYLAYDGIATVNVYPFGKFDKLWVRVGGGLFGTSINTTTRTTSNSFTGVFSLGWRFLIQDPISLFNVGFAVGGQYYSINGATVTLPHALLEIALFL